MMGIDHHHTTGGRTVSFDYNPYVVRRNIVMAAFIFCLSVILSLSYWETTATHDMSALMKGSFLAVLGVQGLSGLYLLHDASRIATFLRRQDSAVIVSPLGVSARMRKRTVHILWRKVREVRYISGPEGASLAILATTGKRYIISFSRVKAEPYALIGAVERNSRFRVTNLPAPVRHQRMGLTQPRSVRTAAR